MSVHIYNSVIDNNTNNGIKIWDTTLTVTLHNTIISNNGEYGVYFNPASPSDWHTASHNCFYNNTSGAVNAELNGGVVPGYGNLTSDPMFYSTQVNNEDYRLRPGSPCRDEAMGYRSGL